MILKSTYRDELNPKIESLLHQIKLRECKVVLRMIYSIPQIISKDEIKGRICAC